MKNSQTDVAHFFPTIILKIKFTCGSKRCLLDNPQLLFLKADPEEILRSHMGSVTR